MQIFTPPFFFKNLQRNITTMKKIFRSVLTAAFIITMSAYSAQSLTALAEKYPLTITAEAKENFAEIRISGALYEWNNSTEVLTAKIDKLLADGYKDVKVYINSPGGDVFVGAEIVNQLKRFPGKKQGFGGAIVASAATAIAIEMDTFEMAENGQFMYHKPSGYISGNEDKIESSLTLLKNLTSQYKTKYSEKTGLSEEDIESAWAKGDVWLTAKQALEQKFITSVAENEKITKNTAEMIAAFGAPIIPKEDFKPEPDMKNRNAIIASLKLSADATDEQIEAAINKSVEDAGKVEQITAQQKETRKTEINEMLDKAITAKKFTADLKGTYETLANADFDGTKKAIEAMQPVAKPSEHFEAGEGNKGREKWTMEDWQEKDAEGLIEMMTKNPEDFKKLETEYFGK